MKVLLVLTTTITLLLMVIIMRLLLKIRILGKKIKYVDEANMWHRLAVTDDLTGVYNRNAYNLYIKEIKKNINEERRGIILFDVDDFKKYNDSNGHLEGDEILKKWRKFFRRFFRNLNTECFE